MTSFSRTLKFRTDKEISEPISVLLPFDKPNDVEPKGVYQVAWRVLKFGGPNEAASVTYEQNLMFAVVQVDDDEGAKKPLPHIAIKIGERTALVDKESDATFQNTIPGTPGYLSSINRTRNIHLPNLAIGYLDAEKTPNPLLVWTEVEYAITVVAKFAPIITGYITLDSAYEQGQLIREPISYIPLLNQDLTSLPDVQAYTITRNSDGYYLIIPTNSD